MKKIFFIALAASLAGCSPKPDPRIAELETKVTKLQDQCDANLKYINSVSDLMDIEYAQQTNAAARFRAQLFSLEHPIDPNTGLPLSETPVDPKTGLPITPESERLSKLEMQYSNLVLTINGGHAPQNISTPAVNGIPAEVMAQIRAKAASSWPDNFDMQELQIKEESQAWLRLHGAQ